jgi:hypothetical protein
MSANTLLINTTILKERTSIHGNVDDKLLYPDIKYAQDVYIKPVLGTALYEKLQSLITGVTPNNINDAANADYKYLIDTYVIDSLLYFSLSYLVINVSLQLWNKGVVRKHGEDTDLPSMSELFDLSNMHKNRGEYYANRMKLFIQDQSGRLQKYPEYRMPGSTVDTITPEQRNFSSPIWLGSDSDDRRPDNPYCNPGGFTGAPYHD